MHHFNHCLLACILAGSAPTLLAGSYIESRDADDVRQRLYIDGPLARIESDDADEYVILDMQQHRYYSVNDLEQQIVDMSSLLRKSTAAPKNSGVQFIKQGAGPKIGGYATERYRVVYKNTHCFDELLSVEALKIPDLKRYYTAAQQMDVHDIVADAGADAPAMEGICAAAASLLTEAHYADLGVPMSALDTRGEVEHEIVQIVVNISFPAETFQLPAEYERVSIADVMRESAHELLKDKALSEPP
ncbi:MAG: hypothetical protein AABY83_03845 [Pseudomonadota bacterium]